MLVFWLCLVQLLVSNPSHAIDTNYAEYCIIGGGPAGIQMAYFLQSSNRDYIVFERYNKSGSFFVDYPRHRTLLSINKRYTGSSNDEFNLRHDWNSLLSNNLSLRFTAYSFNYFPSADDLVVYFNDYAKYLNLNIKYNHHVSNIKMVSNAIYNFEFHILSSNEMFPIKQRCKYLLLGTGRSIPNIPNKIKGLKSNSIGYEDMNLDSMYYENKSVAIMGMGNTAFEIADSIIDHTARIAIYGRHNPRLAFLTHYVGDLRAINSQLFDQYQLKSLDSIITIPIDNDYGLYPCDQTKGVRIMNEYLWSKKHKIPSISTNCWNIIIRALGFLFDDKIFDKKSKPKNVQIATKKWLDLTTEYESSNIPNLYVIGELMHSRDYQKSAGGFIHGFRYLIRSLYHILEYKNHQIEIPFTLFDNNNNNNNEMNNLLLSHIFKRVNEASAPYQMYGVIGDIIIFNNNNNTIKYVQDILLDAVIEKNNIYNSYYHIINESDFILWYFNFGSNFKGCKVIGNHRVRTNEPYHHGHCSGLLHPVFKFYHHQTVIHQFHIIEDVGTDWTSKWRHINPLNMWFNKIIKKRQQKNWNVESMEDCGFQNTLDEEQKNASFKLIRQNDGTFKLKMITNDAIRSQKTEL